jgi:hypothetical protein
VKTAVYQSADVKRYPMKVDDLYNLPKARGGGECYMCERRVFGGEGYRTLLPTGDHVFMHVNCYVRYAGPKFVEAGILKEE